MLRGAASTAKEQCLKICIGILIYIFHLKLKDTHRNLRWIIHIRAKLSDSWEVHLISDCQII